MRQPADDLTHVCGLFPRELVLEILQLSDALDFPVIYVDLMDVIADGVLQINQRVEYLLETDPRVDRQIGQPLVRGHEIEDVLALA